MSSRYKFFAHRQCEFFPCHQGADPERFNCLFCFCPLYLVPDCGGEFTRLSGGAKDCSGCLIPHRRENYGRILEKYPQIADLAKQNRTKDEEK